MQLEIGLLVPVCASSLQTETIALASFKYHAVLRLQEPQRTCEANPESENNSFIFTV